MHLNLEQAERLEETCVRHMRACSTVNQHGNKHEVSTEIKHRYIGSRAAGDWKMDWRHNEYFCINMRMALPLHKSTNDPHLKKILNKLAK